MIVDMLIKIFYSKNMFKKLLIPVITVFLLLIFAFTAEASTLYLSPSKTSVGSGGTVSVSVGLNTSGESVNAVAAYLNYPTDKLEAVGISYGGSFSIAAEGSYGGGSVRVSRGSISGVVGSVTVATIRFKGKAQGVATVSFVGGSAAPRTSDSSESLAGTSPATITVGPPSPASQTTPAPKSTDTEKPVISNLTVSEVATNEATITWQTNEDADSTVEYGLNQNKYFLSAVSPALSKTHLIKLEEDVLLPGSTMYFRAKSKDKAGNEGVSAEQTLQLKGYTVMLKILDAKTNTPLKDTDVFLYTIPLQSRTDLNGEVTFNNVTPGRHLVVVKLKNNLEKTEEVEVIDSATPQSFVVTVDTTQSPSTWISLAIIIIAALGIGIVVVKKMKRSKA